MLKKALRVTTAFGVLLAGYAAYVHVFALLAGSLAPSVRVWTNASGQVRSRTAREAKDHAVHQFGPDSFAAADDLPIRIYNSERGFWMYAQNYRRLGDGKQVEFTPFAVIWVSRDAKSYKTCTADRALLDFDQPLNLIAKPGDSGNLRVVHARIEGNVVLRDDQGTPGPADDLRITRLTYLDYDEHDLDIKSDSDVLIEQGPDLRTTGTGLLIELRPLDDRPAGAPVGPSGFNGAKTAFLNRNVHIFMRDVGPTGVLPGNPAEPPARAAAARREPTPLDVRCDGLMRVDLPKPRPFVRVGPPAPQDPTVAQFSRNVEVLRGPPARPRDQLTCDHLRLVLVPAVKAGKDKEQGKGQEEGRDANADAGPAAPGSNLTLRRAEATGHNVRLVSPSQGIKARCNELIHEKLLPESPDKTYFRGDATTRLIVEKEDVATEGPDKGKVTAYTKIRTIDATIFDDGRGNEFATIVARGPGEMESCPGPNKPVERTAHWLDQLTLRAETAPAPRAGDPPVTLKRVDLTGSPRFADVPSRSTLDAQRLLVIWLAPRPRPPAPAAGKPGVEKPGTGAAPAGGSFEIEKLVAIGDVHLKAPGKTLTARDRLDARFEAQDGPAAPTAVVDARSTALPANPPATATTSTTAIPAAKTKADAPARPAEPESRAVANKVWAKVWLRPAATPAASTPPATAPAQGGLLADAGGGRHAEIDRVFLRGAVDYHQDPGAGKSKGTDVTGEAVDVYNQGEGVSKFVVFDHDPLAPAPARRREKPLGFDALKKDFPAALDPDDDADVPLARVETDELTIRGEAIGLDQSIDQAWVDGRGSLTQLASAGLLSDKAPGPAKPDDAPRGAKAAAATTPPPKSPMTVTFARKMRFFGRSTDPKGRPVARAEFYDDVHAWTDDASLDCADLMRVYLDRVVKLARPKADPKSPAPRKADEDRADVALIECYKDVVAVNIKLDPETRELLQKQRIVGETLTYEKATGWFVVPGAGEVFLYEREGQGQGGPGGPNLGLPGNGNGNRNGVGNANAGRTVRRTSGPARVVADAPAAGAPAPRGPAVIGRNAVGNAADARARARAVKRPLPPLVLTQVYFTREMHGRFGTGKSTDTAETRYADFFGDVQVIRGQVASDDTVFDPDDRPAEAQFITSQILRVVSEPSLDPKAPRDAPPRYLMRAWEETLAYADDRTISADTVTYDSLYNIFYAYGEDGRDVQIAQHAQFGQAPSVTEGRAAMYNAKDGQATLIDPKNVALIDARTGQRPYHVKPKDEKLKKKLPPRAKFRNLRGNIERKDFTGR